MIFRSEEDYEFFQQDGYVVIDLLEESVVNRLRDHFVETETLSGIESNFYTSIWSENKDFRQQIDAVIKAELKNALQGPFENFKTAFANFMVKKPGDSSALQPHQDWSFVEEPMYYSVTVWIPLQDVDETNGALEVLPKSQMMSNFIRARFLNSPFNHQLDAIKENLMLSIPLKKGQAIVVNSRTIHASPNNISNTTRVAASIVLYPEEATLKHYVLNKDAENEVFELNVDQKFFTDYSCFEEPNSALMAYKTFNSHEQIDLFKLIQSYEN